MRFLQAVTNPVLWRGVERLCILTVTGFFGWMGYRLFMFGITEGHAKFSSETPFHEIIFSGTGAGLFFLLVGGLSLLIALFKDGVNREAKHYRKENLSTGDYTNDTCTTSSERTRSSLNTKSTPEVQQTTVSHTQSNRVSARKNTSLDTHPSGRQHYPKLEEDTRPIEREKKLFAEAEAIIDTKEEVKKGTRFPMGQVIAEIKEEHKEQTRN